MFVVISASKNKSQHCLSVKAFFASPITPRTFDIVLCCLFATFFGRTPFIPFKPIFGFMI